LAVSAIVIIGVLSEGAPRLDLSTPEKTIAEFYSALNRSDPAAFDATLWGQRDTSAMNFGVPTTYNIVEVKKIRSSNREQKGDVEVLVHAEIKFEGQPVRLATMFWLLQTEDGWKILEWASEKVK